jgi:RNA polymerase sigma-70 factor, ECF subfamily
MNGARLAPRAMPEHEADAQVLARIAAGDLSALGALFDRHGWRVRRLLGRLGIAAGDLDDLVQLTFLDAARAAEKYDGRLDATPWISGLALMTARRHRRSAFRMLTRIRDWALEPRVTQGSSPEVAFELKEAAADARRALEQLPEKKREVFVMVVLQGLSGEEAARALDIPVATVWTRLHHARRDLRASLEALERGAR